MAILKVDDISISFGGLSALSNINLQLRIGEIMGLIGPNGSGKSTLLNVISGIYKPDTGNVNLNGDDITALPSHLRANRGIGRTFQVQHLFSNMTVLENVITGLHKDFQIGFFSTAFRVKRAKATENAAKGKAFEALKFFGLEDRADRMISELSSIEQRLVEIARALVADHDVILLDEPAAGLSPAMVKEMDEVLRRIKKERKVSILLVEHILPLVMSVSDWITVLNFGQKIADGTPEDIKRNPIVLDVYLGKEGGYASNPGD